MNYCPKFKAILVAKSPNGDMLIARTRCKMWDCPYCATVNQKQWRAKIINHIQLVGGNWTWFTLTAHSKARGELSLKNLRSAWDKLVKRMKRMFGRFEYCRVFERHKDGSYHLHAIASFHFGDIKDRKARKDGKKTKYSVWLKRNSTELKLGYYTHADDINVNHSGYIASYVTKYMTKFTSNQKSEVGRIRHIQVSQGWTKYTPESTYEWRMTDAIYERDLIEASKRKANIIDIQTGEIITWDNFIDHVVYPADFEEIESRM